MGGRKNTNILQDTRVLVVDPNPVDLEAVSQGLREAGLRVVALSRYDAVMPLFEAFSPRAAIIGVHGDGIDAVECARRLRRRAHGTLPIWFVGDATNATLRRDCVRRGHGLELLNRPVDVASLLLRLGTAIDLVLNVERVTRVTSARDGHGLVEPVTGLFNQRQLLACVDWEIRRSERYGGEFSLVLAGISQYGRMRNRLGPDALTRVLLYVSSALAECARSADQLARTDAAEFALLLPDTSADGARSFARRVESRFAVARVQTPVGAVRPRVHLATMSFPDEVATAAELFALARRKLWKQQQGPLPLAGGRAVGASWSADVKA